MSHSSTSTILFPTEIQATILLTRYCNRQPRRCVFHLQLQPFSLLEDSLAAEHMTTRFASGTEIGRSVAAPIKRSEIEVETKFLSIGPRTAILWTTAFVIQCGIGGVLAVPNMAIDALLGTKGCGVESRPSGMLSRRGTY
ncbi:hypothetical protein RU639_009493 [Aspergillus parasiticus]